MIRFGEDQGIPEEDSIQWVRPEKDYSAEYARFTSLILIVCILFLILFFLPQLFLTSGAIDDTEDMLINVLVAASLVLFLLIWFTVFREAVISVGLTDEAVIFRSPGSDQVVHLSDIRDMKLKRFGWLEITCKNGKKLHFQFPKKVVDYGVPQHALHWWYAKGKTPED